MTSSRRHHLKVTFNNQDSNVAVCLSDVKTGIYLLCVTVMIVAQSEIIKPFWFNSRVSVFSSCRV